MKMVQGMRKKPEQDTRQGTHKTQIILADGRSTVLKYLSQKSCPSTKYQYIFMSV